MRPVELRKTAAVLRAWAAPMRHRIAIASTATAAVAEDRRQAMRTESVEGMKNWLGVVGTRGMAGGIGTRKRKNETGINTLRLWGRTVKTGSSDPLCQVSASVGLITGARAPWGAGQECRGACAMGGVQRPAQEPNGRAVETPGAKPRVSRAGRPRCRVSPSIVMKQRMCC